MDDRIIDRPVTGTGRFFGWIAIALLLIGIDQLTKWAIVEWVPLYGKVPLNTFMNLTHQQNAGAAFSFLANASGWQRWFFVALGLIVSGVILIWIWRIRRVGPWILTAGLTLVLAGAIGNLIDRIRFGYVTDFMQVWFGSWAFPSFNVADSAISVGAAFLIIDALFVSGRRGKATGE